MIGALVVAALAAALAAGATEEPAWPQWGGPNRNFVVAGPAPATTWPADGPRELWRRPLGDGLSAIVSDGATLYTLYRRGDADVAVALEAASGRTRWERAFAAPFRETCSHRLGPIPRAAPLIAGERLITVSAGGLMNAFERETGRLAWRQDLYAGAPDAVRACGYSSSPLAFEDLVITTAGGKGRGVVALHAATGEVAWTAQDFENGYASPLVIDLGGRSELVVFTYGEVSGLDPRTGALEWSWPHPADQGVNVAMPVWDDDRLLFVSSAYNGGGRVLELTRRGDAVDVREVWSSPRIRIHFGNAVRLGTRVYASSGDFGAAPFAAVDIRTGEILWRDRSVARSTVIGAGGRLILLDEDGTLVLATPGESGLTVHASAPVLKGRAWTVPTLCGSTLYLRDSAEIVALRIG